jgi:iron(III) transport system ATP-binding protein
VQLDVDGVTMHGTARGANVGRQSQPLISVEEVRISATQVDNALELPLLTCMYLGDRWECLFKRGEIQRARLLEVPAGDRAILAADAGR